MTLLQNLTLSTLLKISVTFVHNIKSNKVERPFFLYSCPVRHINYRLKLYLPLEYIFKKRVGHGKRRDQRNIQNANR